MTNNTAFILPQWLLPKENGMKCRSHETIIGMLAVYNIVSTVVSVLLAGPFFHRQKQRLWQWTRRILHPCTPCFTRAHDGEELPPNEVSFWPFIMSVLGSIFLALSAPLLAGIAVSRNHMEVNRWVLIEQWSTRPRATFFTVFINFYLALIRHETDSTQREKDSYFESAVISIFTEFFIGFFGIKFLWDQTNIKSPTVYQTSTPCTTLGTAAGGESNCPDMQTGANGLVVAICMNGAFTLILALLMKDKKHRMGLVAGMSISLFCIFIYSWEIWANFLHRATEEMYCIEAATEIDVIYCLLPVLLGLWRLAWSVGKSSDQVSVL